MGGGGHGWEENFPLILIIQKRRNSCFMNVWRKVLSEMMFDVGCGGEGGNDICCFCINSCWNKIVSVYSV